MPFITCQKCKLKTFLFLADLCFCSLLFYFSNESVCMFPIIGNKELTRVLTHELAHLSGPYLATDFFFFFQIIMCVSTDACGAQRAHWRQSPAIFLETASLVCHCICQARWPMSSVDCLSPFSDLAVLAITSGFTGGLEDLNSRAYT